MGDGAAAGILLVDKPGGMTSHDVVARTRRAMGTRKVGHAGTLDPMATGLLVLGVEQATRLLTYVVGLDKTYTATLRLGAATDTDDAEGDMTSRAPAEVIAALDDEAVASGISPLTGAILQTPSRVSAIKINGRRAYDLARAGEDVELAARPVVVSRFEVRGSRRVDGFLDLDVVVDCSSGTYIRALARDLGEALGVGGHLTALRRTRIGPFEVADAIALDDLADAAPQRMLDPARAASAVLPAFAVDADQARDLRHGKRVAGLAERWRGEHAAVLAPDGDLVGIVERRGDVVKSIMNMATGR